MSLDDDIQGVKLSHITTVPLSLGFLRGQIGYMLIHGFEVEAISSPGVKLDEFGNEQGIHVHAIELPRRITPWHDLMAVWQLSWLLRRTHPSIVHAHTPKGGLLGMISSWINRIPLRIYHMRGLPYMSASGKKRTLLKLTERISCRLAHRVFCVSHSIREVAIADSICSADRIVVLGGGSGNGVDSSIRFNPGRFALEEVVAKRAEKGIAADEIVIGFVGRIVRDKGIQELIAAWQMMRNSHAHARLVLVGPVEPQDPVAPETLALLHEDDRVTMIDWVDDTSEVYPLFDLVVLPTYREGFPNVPLEAAAMELPVVATRVPGCIDAVEDCVTGTLVPVRDADALATAIAMYIVDPELREKHGRAGRERVLRDFRQEVIWEAMYQEYCRLLREKGLSVPTPLENPE